MQQYRYPGTRPFTTDDLNLFYGRDDDIKSLSDLISLENIVVLYGKSGLGKTSLINAGVIPYLKKDGNYETKVIRFGAYIAESSLSPIEILKHGISKNQNADNFIYNKLISKADITQHQLWYVFKELQLQQAENPCYLLIFDQFEELFTYPEQQVEQFKKELSELLNVKLPQQVRNILKDKLFTDKEYLTKEETLLLYKSLNIKIVFSIRSDRMNFLNRMTDYLPNILKKCYELQPLTNKQAETAILEPAKKVSTDFVSPVFSYETNALNGIINFLSRNGEQKIETFLLQIICQYTERIVIKNRIKLVSTTDLGDLQYISKNFYDNIIAELAVEEQQLARILIEEGLIFEEDERRLSLYEGQIYKQFNISKELLQKLVNTHILRAEPYHAGGFVYEISHDTLVSPILSAKKARNEVEMQIQLEKERLAEVKLLKEKAEKENAERIKERNRQRRIITIVSLVALVALVFGIFGFTMWQVANKQTKVVEIKSVELENQKQILENQKKELQRTYDDLRNKSFTEAVAKFEKYISDAKNLSEKGDFGGAIEKYNVALEQIKGMQYKDSMLAINGIKICKEKALSSGEFGILMQKADEIVSKNDEAKFVEALSFYQKALATNSNNVLASNKIEGLQKIIDQRFKNYFDKAVDAIALKSTAGNTRAKDLLKKALALKPGNSAAQQKLTELQ